MSGGLPPRDVAYDLAKIIVQGGIAVVVAVISVVIGGILTYRLKRQTEVADECIEHLSSTVSKAHLALRKLSRNASAHTEADASAESRRKLGELVTIRFKNSRRIVRLIGELTVALGPADPMSRTKMTKARIDQIDEITSRINTSYGLCKAAIVREARGNWTYHIWGKHN